MTSTVDVLVIGAGPMGATAGLALATLGVDVRVVTRYSWLSNSPRAHITNQRSIEALRDLGIEGRLERVASPWELMGETPVVESLAGMEFTRISSWGTGSRHGEYVNASPCGMLDIPQPVLESVLVGAAAERGAVLSLNTQYLRHEQDAEGVTVTLLDRVTGVEEIVRARYLIGADGARSQVVQDAGLPISGEMGRASTAYVRFRADLTAMVEDRPSILYWVTSPDAAFGEIGLGLLRAVEPWSSWIAGWGYDPDRGEPDLTTEAVTPIIRAFIGDPDIPIEILGTSTWQVNQAFAESYSVGRVLAGGDAVHRHPPSGGLGSNTSIQDAYNLAWKLAYVLRGDADPSLLDSYSAERAPVGKQVVQRANRSREDFAGFRRLAAEQSALQSLAEVLTAPDAAGAAARQALADSTAVKSYEFSAHGVELNQRYRSAAIIEDGTPENWTDDPELVAQPTTRPGAKLPHAWLTDAARRRFSTLDLVGGGVFTLLTGPSGWRWVDAVERLSRSWLRSAVIGGRDVRDIYQRWYSLREVDDDGAILVRPDGYVAWRAWNSPRELDDALSALSSALGSVLGKVIE